MRFDCALRRRLCLSCPCLRLPRLCDCFEPRADFDDLEDFLAPPEIGLPDLGPLAPELLRFAEFPLLVALLVLVDAEAPPLLRGRRRRRRFVPAELSLRTTLFIPLRLPGL